MPLTLAETDAFPATLQVPAATEPASAPGLVSQFLQGMANRSRWLYNRINKLTAGGTFTMTGALVFDGQDVTVTATLHTNGLSVGQPASFADVAVVSGLLTANGAAGFACPNGPAHFGSTIICDSYVRAKHGLTSGATSGTAAYAPVGQTVYWDGVSSMASGTVWQISSGSPVLGDWIRFVNDNPQSVIIKNPAGTTLETLGGSAGARISDTFVYNGTAWVGVNPTYH